MLLLIFIYIFLGVIAGTLAGLFGIGGGVILVPALVFCFELLHIPQDVLMHLALGTSLSCIFITGLNSAWTHQKKKNIDWNVFYKLLWGIIIGTILGGRVASYLSSETLEIIFAIFLTFVLVKMSFKPKEEHIERKVPLLLYWVVGGFIGFKSAILGVGGGTISIPFLTWTGKEMKKAVGVSASIGLPISLFGSLAYIYNGHGNIHLPTYSVGYIYLPAFFGIVSTSSLFARIGARMSHSVSQTKLRYLFLTFLGLTVLRTYYGIFFGG